MCVRDRRKNYVRHPNRRFDYRSSILLKCLSDLYSLLLLLLLQYILNLPPNPQYECCRNDVRCKDIHCVIEISVSLKKAKSKEEPLIEEERDYRELGLNISYFQRSDCFVDKNKLTQCIFQYCSVSERFENR